MLLARQIINAHEAVFYIQFMILYLVVLSSQLLGLWLLSRLSII